MPDVPQSLAATLALLERTPAALSALLRGLPEFWTAHNEGGQSWSVFDVLGHLNHAEREDWIPRAKWLLEFGDSRPFPPFDRFGHRSEVQGRSLDQLLDEFVRLRAASLVELQALNLLESDLDRLGLHPALGSVTLRHLLSTWAVHDMTHLHQISRVMAFQGRDEVGPWRVFLGVLKCSAHGE
jgi:hypothetical protein